MKIVYALIGLIVVGAGAWYALQMQQPENTETPSPQQQASEMQSNETQQFRGSMQDLMARGGSWKCDISVTAEGITSTGTTYVAMGMVRADFVSNIPQIGNIESHMIMKDNTAYTWTSMMPRGFKFPVTNGEIQATGANAEAAAQFNQAYDYSCAAWPTDEGKFALPSGITF